MHWLNNRGECRTARCRARPAPTMAPMNQQRNKTGQWPGGRPSDSFDDQRDPSRARLAGVGRPSPFGEEKPRLTNKKPILDESSESAINILHKYVAAHSSC